MSVVLNTVKEALAFIDSFDGYGMTATDEELQAERLRDFDLTDDYVGDDEDDKESAHPVTRLAEKTAFEIVCAENRAELLAFAGRELKINPAREDWNFWSAFSDLIDVQFSICDDDQNPNYNRREVWAYEMVDDGRGGTTTDTANPILITVIAPEDSAATTISEPVYPAPSNKSKGDDEFYGICE